MKPNRFALFALLMVALVGLVGCGSNSSSKTEAEIYLSQNIPTGVADVDISVPVDVAIPTSCTRHKVTRDQTESPRCSPSRTTRSSPSGS